MKIIARIVLVLSCALSCALNTMAQGWTSPTEPLLPGFETVAQQGGVLTSSSGNAAVANAVRTKETGKWHAYYSNWSTSQLHPKIEGGGYDDNALIAVAGRGTSSTTWSQHYLKFGLDNAPENLEAMRISFDIEYIANQTNFGVYIDTEWGGVHEVEIGISSLPDNTTPKTDFLFSLVSLTSNSTVYEFDVNGSDYGYDYRSSYLRYEEGADGKMHVSIEINGTAIEELLAGGEYALLIETKAGTGTGTKWAEYYIMDNFTVETLQAIPEPAAYACAFALIAILAAAFRRR